MASENNFNPDEVREIARNFPDVKRLMIEREQIKQDANHSPTHTKLEPHPKPKGDIHFPKNHKEKDGEKTAREKHFDNKLKENSKEIETAFHDGFEKADLKVMSDWAKEMDTDELIKFMEKDSDAVLDKQESLEEKDIIQDKETVDIRMDEKQEKEFHQEPDKDHEITPTDQKEIEPNKDIEQDLKMDEMQSEKFHETIKNEPSDFEQNSKEITVDKRPSPADDFE